MVNKAERAGLALFHDLEISFGHLTARPSGARIPLTRAFFADAARGASFLAQLQMLRAWRLTARPLSIRTGKGRAVAFYPQRPRPFYAIWPACRLAGIRLVDDPAQADALFFFHDTAFETDAPPPPARNKPVINAGCLDVRKSRVGQAFEKVFGYGLSVDPKTHRGPAVEKSELNGVHDGRIIDCPIADPTPDRVYQRLIENTQDGRIFTDLRTPIVGGRIPVVYLKRRTEQRRISNDNLRVDLASADEVYSKREQRLLAALAEEMGLEFGGMDVLRDRNDGRIYVVDVNKTDMGPPTSLGGADKFCAMRAIGAAFAAHLETRLAAAP